MGHVSTKLYKNLINHYIISSQSPLFLIIGRAISWLATANTKESLHLSELCRLPYFYEKWPQLLIFFTLFNSLKYCKSILIITMSQMLTFPSVISIFSGLITGTNHSLYKYWLNSGTKMCKCLQVNENLLYWGSSKYFSIDILVTDFPTIYIIHIWNVSHLRNMLIIFLNYDLLFIFCLLVFCCRHGDDQALSVIAYLSFLSFLFYIFTLYIMIYNLLHWTQCNIFSMDWFICYCKITLSTLHISFVLK